MTRSVRDLSRRVESLENDADDADDLDIQINYYRVVSRERAEREGREILGEADTPGDTEHVRVDT